MRIVPNSDVPEPACASSVRSKEQTAKQPDKPDVAISAELTRALENIPLVRAAKITQAKLLIQDPSYPAEATLRRIAGVLAEHLDQPDKPA